MFRRVLRAVVVGAALALAAPLTAGAAEPRALSWRVDDFSGTLTVTSAAAPASTCADAGGAPISDTVAARYTTAIDLVRVERRKGDLQDVRLRRGGGRAEYSPKVRLALAPTAFETFRTLTPVLGTEPEACTEGLQTCTDRGRSADTESINFTGSGERVSVRFPARLLDRWFAHCAPRGASLLVPPAPRSRSFAEDGVTEVFS
ncbi:MAG: hypothetical protein H0T15_02675, partial [Thermoleophilaceae bacterium]|nr:hypothetical protein [Thermoleophilaceae bacterium]